MHPLLIILLYLRNRKNLTLKDLIDVKLSKFHNYYRNSEQLKKLKNTVKGSNVKYVDTTQFMCGFYAIRKILNV